MPSWRLVQLLPRNVVFAGIQKKWWNVLPSMQIFYPSLKSASHNFCACDKFEIAVGLLECFDYDATRFQGVLKGIQKWIDKMSLNGYVACQPCLGGCRHGWLNGWCSLKTSWYSTSVMVQHIQNHWGGIQGRRSQCMGWNSWSWYSHWGSPRCSKDQYCTNKEKFHHYRA